MPFICIITIICIVFLACITFFVRYLTQIKYKNFVLENSICLKKLDEINKRYSFYPYVSFDQSYTYDNKKYFDTISCKDYLIYRLQYIDNELFSQIDKITANKQEYSKYLIELNSVTQFGQFSSHTGKLNLAKLIKTERQQKDKKTYQAPTMQFNLTVTLYCSTIIGKIYDKKSEQFSVKDINILNKKLNNKNGSFYNDREIWDAICRVERGKVSNKMRFSIYERDGYKCCKCGISDRYAQLEIDHIIPIAKGGKTTYGNLQTLCHKCNIEKGDKYI